MGKKKKKSKSIWAKLRENPEAVAQMMEGFGGIAAGAKGMVKDPKTGRWRKHVPGEEHG